MPRHRAMLPLALASLLVACAPYRLPQHPHADGSLTNRVIYAYFALAHSNRTALRTPIRSSFSTATTRSSS